MTFVDTCARHLLARTTIVRAALAAVAITVAASPVAYSPAVEARRAAPIPVYTAEVVRSYPHDTRAYTEGLFFHDGRLFESTGGNGSSFIREVDLATGQTLRERRIDSRYFGEGITDWGGQIVSLTWQSGVGFRWGLDSFTPQGTFRYPGEGWALTHDDARLIMSDGTPELRFLEPASFTEQRRLRVTADGQPVANLNELEWVKGAILANVWQTDRIARIDPKTGAVTAWIDCTAISRTMPHNTIDDVLNGIAYDAAGDRLFVTGKRWPKLFEIRLVKAH